MSGFEHKLTYHELVSSSPTGFCPKKTHVMTHAQMSSMGNHGEYLLERSFSMQYVRKKIKSYTAHIVETHWDLHRELVRLHSHLKTSSSEKMNHASNDFS